MTMFKKCCIHSEKVWLKNGLSE